MKKSVCKIMLFCFIRSTGYVSGSAPSGSESSQYGSAKSRETGSDPKPWHWRKKLVDPKKGIFEFWKIKKFPPYFSFVFTSKTIDAQMLF